MGQVADLGSHLVVGGGHQRSRCHIGVEHLGIARHLGHDVLVHAARRLAVEAADVVLHLLGDDAPALARQHVEHRLGANDLRERRDQRRIAHLGAHLGNLGHDLGQAVGRLLHLQLAHEVAHHAAGHLVRVHLHVGERAHAALVVAALADLLPVLRYLEQQVEVEAGVVEAFLERGGDHLHRGVRVAEGQRRMGRVGDGRARFRRLDDVGRCHAAHVMAVDVHRQADLGIERLDHALGAVRRQHARHVLDGDGVGAQVLELLAVLKVAVERVHRRERVGDGALEVRPAGLDGLGVVDDVADVVQGVEHAEHLDAVAVRRSDEVIDDVLGVVLVPHQVLAAREHRQRRVGGVRLDGAQAFPGVLVQEAQARVECRTTPGLDGPVAYLVHLRQDGQHLAYLHPRGPQALLAVADSGVHYLEPWHRCAHLLL